MIETVAGAPSGGEKGNAPSETHSYMEGEGGNLYCVRHHARRTRLAAVLVCGPIGAERERSYRTLVDLSRSLASHGFEVLRFDYRGIGESTGSFEQLCLRDWRDDVERCARALHAAAGDVPLVLWGVRAGALLAAEVFASGVGDAAMLWAPIGGRAMLTEVLRRVLIADMLARTSDAPSTREEIIARLERGDMVSIEGYPWTRKLWEDSESHPLPIPPVGEPRPWRVVDFKGAAATPLPPELVSMRESVNENRFWESSGWLVPRTNAVLDITTAWIRTKLPGNG